MVFSGQLNVFIKNFAAIYNKITGTNTLIPACTIDVSATTILKLSLFTDITCQIEHINLFSSYQNIIVLYHVKKNFAI